MKGGIELSVFVVEESAGTHNQNLKPPHPVLVRGQVQTSLKLVDLKSSLDRERLTAFELGRTPSPPLVKFRADPDNLSIDSCSEIIKSRASTYLFVRPWPGN
jgi:hypothetical protein